MEQVYVVMGNDYPDAVFSSSASAEAYCTRKREECKRAARRPPIHWRVYEFTVDKEMTR